ncbi:uncharacterized protein A4U43_C10F9080 [Asparagus officinalis]|uniref:Uncharacterized protein n=1 Tax=Asparagus officinalis TaxID=4686 RepID=A0A5P1E3D0_ASPOF|nr:uncharacterized protein A4U43_C10F9080 [Asparagus officinalis]
MLQTTDIFLFPATKVDITRASLLTLELDEAPMVALVIGSATVKAERIEKKKRKKLALKRSHPSEGFAQEPIALDEGAEEGSLLPEVVPTPTSEALALPTLLALLTLLAPLLKLQRWKVEKRERDDALERALVAHLDVEDLKDMLKE